MNVLMRAAALGFAASFASAAQADVTLSPRFFLYFDNATQRQSGFDDLNYLADEQSERSAQELTEFFGTPVGVTTDSVTSASINNQMVYPLFGGAATIGLDAENRTQFTISALYGKSDNRLKTLQNIQQTVTVEGFEAEDILALEMDGKSKTKRLDLELTLQHRLNERFALLGGFRYERLRSKGDFNVSFTQSNNASNLFDALFGEGDLSIGLSNTQGRAFTRVDDDVYSVRAGGAAFAPIGSRNTIYVNGLLHVTHQRASGGRSRFVVEELEFDESNKLDISSETTVGPDISVGYIHRLTEKIGIDVRYRGIFYFPVSGNRDFDDPRVNHGLNLGLTFSL